MTLSRRDFLKLGLLATATAAACERDLSDLPVFLPTPVPLPPPGEPVATPPTPVPAAPPDRAWRFLNRAGYGPRPGELARVQALGYEAYVEAQLNPETLSDTTLEAIINGLPYYHRPAEELAALREDKRPEMLRDLYVVTLGSALFSTRQLYAAMVEFWSDHFHIYLHKAPIILPLKVVDDREVIRPNALGKFRDLLNASARSPAMLVYLDNVSNRRGSPNENYARELLELHTLGVDGGYSQADVAEAARVLTGWAIPRRGAEGGPVTLTPGLHDNAAKTVLGQAFPAGQGAQDIQQLLDLLAAHPATARHIAFKLTRRFVADTPPAALVERVAQTYLDSDGDIKAMLRTIFLSEEFAQAPPKLKRPLTYLVSSLRALGVQPQPDSSLGDWLGQLGQPLFAWPAPDGYPDVSQAWVNLLLPRWNFALALCQGEAPGLSAAWSDLDRAVGSRQTEALLSGYVRLLFNQSADATGLNFLQEYVGAGVVDSAESERRLRQCVALLLAGPAFQWM